MVKVLDLGQTVVVQLQLLEVEQTLKVVDADNVLEAKRQVLNLLVAHGLLLLVDLHTP